jgi:hypothetical protein
VFLPPLGATEGLREPTVKVDAGLRLPTPFRDSGGPGPFVTVTITSGGGQVSAIADTENPWAFDLAAIRAYPNADLQIRAATATTAWTCKIGANSKMKLK